MGKDGTEDGEGGRGGRGEGEGGREWGRRWIGRRRKTGEKGWEGRRRGYRLGGSILSLGE